MVRGRGGVGAVAGEGLLSAYLIALRLNCQMMQRLCLTGARRGTLTKWTHSLMDTMSTPEMRMYVHAGLCWGGGGEGM